jgi:hypothetical protein
MNRSTRQPGTASKLSQPTHQRLNSYALAASAAGVGILALTSPAQAKIIYTATHHVIKKGVSYNLDLNRDGKTDFTLLGKSSANTSTFFSFLSAKPAAGNGVRGFGGAPGWASALKPGSVVGPYQYFPGQAMAEVDHTGGGGVYYAGSWLNVKSRYLGLRFKIAGKTHYGWARLSVKVTQSSITATLTGYAFESIPNKAIHAGQTKGTDQNAVERLHPAARAVPTLKSPTLGLLAMGSPGLCIWRRRERSGFGRSPRPGLRVKPLQNADNVKPVS